MTALDDDQGAAMQQAMRRAAGWLAVLGLAACTVAPPRPDVAALREEVVASERAFARSMAERDHAAFVALLAADAVFYSGDRVLRGKAQVAAHWAAYFQAADAPFSWQPEQVEVLDSGQLALSSGPVLDPQGRLIARFTSVWRQHSPGQWRIVFDKGAPACPAGAQ